MLTGSHNYKRVLPFILSLVPFLSLCQEGHFYGVPVEPGLSPDLSEYFARYEVYQMDLEGLTAYVRSDVFDDAVIIGLDAYGTFAMDLFPNPLQSEDYVLSVRTDEGVEHIPYDGIVKTFIGNLKGGQYDVRLTIDWDYLYGYIALSGDKLNIEPLRNYVPGAPRDHIVVYRQSDLLELPPVLCEAENAVKSRRKGKQQETYGETRSVGECLEVEIALADDWLMYQDHNSSVTDVENHNIGVMNNVQGNYDNEFADELHYEIVEIWISTCSSCDPWTSSTNSSTLLSSFSNWAGSGFVNNHDVANLWTDRDFNGPTVGVAWLEGVCFDNWKYATCQDFTANPNFLRVLLAHELGHTFGAFHDPTGSNTIMAPSIVNTDVWSAASINSINNFVSGIGCLGPCQTAAPPVAGVTSDVQSGCAPLVVEFQDNSSGSPDTWSWVFPGGSPGTSAEENPVITYNSAGVFDVILEVSNSAGTSSIVLQDYITVEPLAEADFSYTQVDLELVFTNLSEDAESYLWDFGDGNTSTETHPAHLYAEDGQYTVTLTATNDCGSTTHAVTIDLITAPVADFDFTPSSGCQPLTVSFINMSSNNTETSFWTFPGGTPSTSVEMHPTVVYEQPGTYSVTLVVENIVGQDVLTINDAVVVDPLPVADFGTIVDGAQVLFQNASSYGINYTWDFGDGTTSGAVNPTHTYAQGGSYTVQLVVENECGIDIATMDISVLGLPAAGINISDDVGCAPFEVEFASTSEGEVDSYFWSFPGGNPSTSTAPSVVVSYNTPGQYPVQLIVSNDAGADTITLNPGVVVNAPVISDFDYTLQGAEADFINLSSGAGSYQWIVDGQVFTSQHLSYLFQQDGDYTVTLIASGTCGNDTTVQNLHVATLPVAAFGAAQTHGCEPFTVQFFDQSTPNATMFEWSFPGGDPASSTLEEPVVTYTEPGVYSVSLTVWSEVGSDAIEIADFIHVAPLPEAEFQTIQEGLHVEFVNTSEDAAEYTWVFGDGLQSNVVNPAHDYTTFGTYQVMLIASNDCGSDTAYHELALATLPVPLFSAEQSTGCTPFEVQFADQSQNGVESWEWSFPGGNPATSALQNPVVVYYDTGVYTVTLKVTNSAGAQALVRENYIVVGDLPIADFAFDIQEDVITLENLSSGAQDYIWLFGDGEASTEPDPEHTYPGNGHYSLSLIAVNHCGADTLTTVVQVNTTSTGEVRAEQRLFVYPNPNRGSFHVTIAESEQVDLWIVDMLGRIIFKRMDVLNEAGQALYLQPNNMAPGMYYIVVESDKWREFRQIVVDLR